MNDLIGLGLGLILFLCSISAYLLGIKHGRQMTQGVTPKLNLNPVKAVTEAIEQHKEAKEAEALTDDLAEVMTYSAETALKAVKRGQGGET